MRRKRNRRHAIGQPACAAGSGSMRPARRHFSPRPIIAAATNTQAMPQSMAGICGVNICAVSALSTVIALAVGPPQGSIFMTPADSATSAGNVGDQTVVPAGWIEFAFESAADDLAVCGTCGACGRRRGPGALDNDPGDTGQRHAGQAEGKQRCQNDPVMVLLTLIWRFQPFQPASVQCQARAALSHREIRRIPMPRRDRRGDPRLRSQPAKLPR